VVGVIEGDNYNEKTIQVIRPGDGLLPKYYDLVISKKAACNVKKGTPMS
tara:strand:- start:8358 stop:8504 length:147 start_codon:yes stop_codon:yes gene_type:complete